jgi:Fur family transcriptional regulator, ferric uptake regulator
MTTAHSIEKEMRAYREALSTKGLSATRQRLTLGEIVFSTHGHFTADDLVGMARKAGVRVGRVTIYRTLTLMVDAGLVEERQFNRGRMHYEHTIGHRHHDHMVCVSCGKILEFEDAAIERHQQAAAQRHGFAILHHSHTLFGYCRGCVRSPRSPEATSYGRQRPSLPGHR